MDSHVQQDPALVLLVPPDSDCHVAAAAHRIVNHQPRRADNTGIQECFAEPVHGIAAVVFGDTDDTVAAFSRLLDAIAGAYSEADRFFDHGMPTARNGFLGHGVMEAGSGSNIHGHHAEGFQLLHAFNDLRAGAQALLGVVCQGFCVCTDRVAGANQFER